MVRFIVTADEIIGLTGTEIESIRCDILDVLNTNLLENIKVTAEDSYCIQENDK